MVVVLPLFKIVVIMMIVMIMMIMSMMIQSRAPTVILSSKSRRKEIANVKANLQANQ